MKDQRSREDPNKKLQAVDQQLLFGIWILDLLWPSPSRRVFHESNRTVLQPGLLHQLLEDCGPAGWIFDLGAWSFGLRSI